METLNLSELEFIQDKPWEALYTNLLWIQMTDNSMLP